MLGLQVPDAHRTYPTLLWSVGRAERATRRGQHQQPGAPHFLPALPPVALAGSAGLSSGPGQLKWLQHALTFVKANALRSFAMPICSVRLMQYEWAKTGVSITPLAFTTQYLHFSLLHDLDYHPTLHFTLGKQHPPARSQVCQSSSDSDVHRRHNNMRASLVSARAFFKIPIPLSILESSSHSKIDTWQMEN